MVGVRVCALKFSEASGPSEVQAGSLVRAAVGSLVLDICTNFRPTVCCRIVMYELSVTNQARANGAEGRQWSQVGVIDRRSCSLARACAKAGRRGRPPLVMISTDRVVRILFHYERASSVLMSCCGVMEYPGIFISGVVIGPNCVALNGDDGDISLILAPDQN